MPEPERAVWLRVANGVESLSDRGDRVWLEPAQTRKALGELLGVFPLTHVQIDIAHLMRASDGATWSALLNRQDHWPELLSELALALRSALRPPAVWGLGLPSPSVVATALGDASERGLVKAGLQLAGFLQAFREAHLAFIGVDLGVPAPAGEPRALTPIFRNSEMYGWRRALCVAELDTAQGARLGADVALAARARIAELRPAWERGEPVGGGLGDGFWSGEDLEPPAPARFLLYGEVPAGTPPRTLVQAGRMVRAWMS